MTDSIQKDKKRLFITIISNELKIKLKLALLNFPSDIKLNKYFEETLGKYLEKNERFDKEEIKQTIIKIKRPQKFAHVKIWMNDESYKTLMRLKIEDEFDITKIVAALAIIRLKKAGIDILNESANS